MHLYSTDNHIHIL